jgi:hypothetical protein
MFKIRVKNTPGTQKTGDQSEYGLVRNLAAVQTNSQEARVNDKMGAVPRDKATIEVEGGESVIGDVNNDGNMELMHFVGKRHSEGGVPVNIGEGSFIFSDTKSLIIKDEEVITKLFGLPFRKKGYTPSEISKNFDINKYIQILKDDSADEMSKRTAAEMLAKNKEKLGILAFIQESMKGFPDGIPQIAEEVMSKMGLNPEQLVQESQPPAPEQPQMGQPGQEQGMPTEEQMQQMMAQQQGMQEGMPQQGMQQEMPQEMQMPEGEMMQGKFGGLMKFPDGGDASKRLIKKLYDAGYDAEYSGNGKLSYRVPGAYDYVMLDELDTTKINSLLNNPIPRFKGDSGFERGNIYTFKSRPDTYYRMGNDGKIYIKNKGNDWQYKEMDDPDGGRRKVLEAGFKSGLTKEFIPTIDLPEVTVKGTEKIPGFGGKKEFNEYKASGGKQAVAADLFYGALRSKDPNAMLEASKELLTNKDFDIDYSVSWLPFTDQDKIDDMSMILSQEASKLLNKKHKETVKQYANNASTKADELIKYYNTQLNSINYTDVSAKIAMQKKLDDAKKYKQVLQSGEYKEWVGDVNSSNPVTKPDFFGTPRWDGAFVNDRKADSGEWSRFHDYNQLSMVEVLKAVDKNYAAIKGTKPIGSKIFDLNSDGDNVSYMDGNSGLSDYERVSGVRDIIDNTYSDKSSVNPVTKGRFKLPGDNSGDYYFSEYDPAEGKKFYHKVEALSGATLRVDDPSMYGTLNKISGLNITAPEGMVQQDSEEPVQEEVVPVKERLRSSNVVAKPHQITPQTQQQVTPQKPAGAKYEGGLSDDDFNNMFKKYGGEMDEYEDGGVIDSFGHMVKLPKSYLKQYALGGPPTETAGDDKVVNGVTYKTSSLKYDDGTVVQIVKDASGKIVSQRALAPGSTGDKAIGISLKEGQKLYRGLTEVATAENLTDEEKANLGKSWSGKTEDYLNFQNTRAKLFSDPEFTTEMMSQYQAMVNDPSNEMFTGNTPTKKKYFADKYSKDLKGLSPTDVMSSLLEQEERNARMRSAGYDPTKGEQNVAGFGRDAALKTDPRAWQTNAYTIQFLKDHPELQDLDFSKGYRGQAAYLGYSKALQNPKFKGYSEAQTGVGDEGVLGLSSGITGVENYNNNTTTGQFINYKGKIIPEKEKITETPQGKWYCVDGTVVQSTVDAASGAEVRPTGTKIEGPYDDQATASAICKVPEDTNVDKEIPNQSDGWFAPDIVNYATAMAQQTPFTLPTLQQMQAPPSGYDTLNPITQIASILGAQKQYSDQLSNTMDPNSAAAAGANFDFAALAGGIGGIEADNQKITTGQYDKTAQRTMQTDQYNAEKRGQYNRETGTAIDERAKDYNAKQALTAKMFGSGWWNAAKDEGYREMYPEAHHINRISGKYGMTGPGRNPFEPDTAGTLNGSSSGDVTAEAQAAYDRAYDAAIKGGKKPEEATKLADLASKQAYNDHNYNRQKRRVQGSNPYASSVNSLGGGRGYTGFGASNDYDFE